MEDQIKKEQGMYVRMPPKYIAFTIKFKKFWILLNLISIASSCVMAWLGVRVNTREYEQKSVGYQECIGMHVVIWMWFALHISNAMFSAMALCNLEKKLCHTYVMLALLIFDLIVLVWSQTVYFNAMAYNCQLEMPEVYFFLMGEILYFYVLTAFVVCYFFRRFCQDPVLKKKMEEEAKAELDQEAGLDNTANTDIQKDLTPSETP